MAEKIQHVDWVEVVIKRKYFIVAAAVACALAAFGASFVIPKTYQSGLVLKVGKFSYATTKGLSTDVTTEDLESVSTVKDQIESEPFMAEVIARLKLDTMPDKLLNKVKVKINTDAAKGEENRQVIVTVKADTPEQAVRFANAVGGLVMELHKKLYDQAMAVHVAYEKDLDSQVGQISGEITSMKAAIRSVEKNPRVDAPAVILLEANLEDREKHLTDLIRELNQAKALGHTMLKSENTSVAIPPYKPTSPVSPRPAISFLAGLFAGAVGASVYAFYRESRRMRGLEG